MSGCSGVGSALMSLRLLGYVVLLVTLFFFLMSPGKWYKENIFPNFQLEVELEPGGATISHYHNQRGVFLFMPIMVAAALGGIYEAIWKARERRDHKLGVGRGSGGSSVVSGESEHAEKSTTTPFALLCSVIHYQFRPLGCFSPWMSVGEILALGLWVSVMISHVWQGTFREMESYYDDTDECHDGPSSRCYIENGLPAPTAEQFRLQRVAILMGFVASLHFAVILIPVSRDSKLWSAVGIPFERAVLYHVIAGHLAFTAVFTHCILFVAYWVWTDGWKHAWVTSTSQVNEQYGYVDVPMGWAAALCAVPMWITSINYVRRRWYSLFKASHWLFIGVFLFGALHWSSNASYFAMGLTLYTMHVMSRLSSWKRWRYWNRWWNPATRDTTPTSLVNICTIDNYTRLVLRNPKSHEPARGGSFVYISAPGALGTDEAHAMTVALRGAPPSFSPEKNRASSPQEDVFTLYVKALGPWTKALRSVAKGAEAACDPSSMLVDVDGFYTHVTSFNTMLHEGAGRIVVVAGGSGVTSLMGFIQDWCVAASTGVSVPEVHLVWSCRSMKEMELVGESLPSLLASAGRKKDSHFTMSLYCTGKGESGPLTVTWPLDNTHYSGSSQEHVLGKTPVASSLNHSVRVVIASAAGFGGYVLGQYELDRRQAQGFHAGGVLLTLIVVCIISALLVYDWVTGLIQMCLPKRATYSGMGGTSHVDESKTDTESAWASNNSATYQVSRGRVPANELFSQEAVLAHKKGLSVVKVLTSGPHALVDSVLTQSRAVDWKLFDTEEFSFEF